MKKQAGFAIFALCLVIFLFQACLEVDLSDVVSQANKNIAAVSDETEGGHEHGNGGDDTRFAKAAWFSESSRSVKYCVQVGNSFPLSQERVVALTQSALADWKTVLASKSVYSMSLIPKVFVLEADCNLADLRLLIGMPNPDLIQDPVGVAHRELADIQENWSHGFIWISGSGAQWSEEFRLKGALLHLLGEVLGFDSVKGTIMDERWQQWLVEPRSPQLENRLSSIESERQLSSSNGIFKGSIQISEKLKVLLGIDSTVGVENVEVDTSHLKFKIQNRELAYFSVHETRIIHGDIHRVAYRARTAFMKLLTLFPNIYSEADESDVMIIQFHDLPGQPQMILELNGETAVNLTPF